MCTWCFALSPAGCAQRDRASIPERLHRYVVEMHDTTARAYGMPTQADFARAVALRTAAAQAELAFTFSAIAIARRRTTTLSAVLAAG